jgi:dephospho-CoA kinase
MLIIGLTGGVASGKSAVAELLEGLGAALIDTDVVAREVVAPGERGLALIIDAFGPGILSAEGELDRRKLRSSVFADDTKRRRLEEILHPLIRARVLERIAALRGVPYVVIAVPLLIETDFDELVDRVLVVDVPVETQFERLIARDGIGRAEAEAMIAAQADRATRLAHADDVIDNSGDLAATRVQAEALHRRYLELATVCRDGAGRAK